MYKRQHVIGYVGAMSQGQADRLLQRGYLPSERVGKAGIEQIFEADLHGRPGETELEVDSTGRVHRIVSQTKPEPGSDIYLTIDADLQAATESYLTRTNSCTQNSKRRQRFLLPCDRWRCGRYGSEKRRCAGYGITPHI